MPPKGATRTNSFLGPHYPHPPSIGHKPYSILLQIRNVWGASCPARRCCRNGVHLSRMGAFKPKLCKTNNGSAARTSEAQKRQHYARPVHVSFDERSFKLTTLAVESFGLLEDEGYEFIDELATHMPQEEEMGDRYHRKGSSRNDFFFRSFRWLHR